MRLKEPEEFARHSMKRKTPYTLVLKYYWWRLLCVSIIWFLYDVSLTSLPDPGRRPFVKFLTIRASVG
jgi:hypothetical protein